MSERTLHNQPSAAKPSLEDLRVSHGRDSTPANSPDPKTSTPLDLTQVSMETREMIRLSARHQRRTVSTAPAQAPTPSKETAQNKATPVKRFGVFKNPKYRYEGGPLGMLISFVANILKALEQLVFRTREISPRPQPQTVPTSSTPQPTRRKKLEDDEPEFPTLSPPRLS